MIERLIVWVVYFIVCALAIVPVVRRRGTIFEFPFLISASTIGFILPQALTCCFKRDLVADDAYFITMVHGIICHVMGYVGYYSFKTPPFAERPAPLDPYRIFHIGALQVFAGVTAYILMDVYVYKEPFGLFMSTGMYATQWEGLVVAIEFFCKMVFPGSMMCFFAMLAMRRPGIHHWIIFAIGMFYPILTIVLLGRRNSVMMVAGTFILPLFYVRKSVPRGWVVFFGAIAMGLLVFLLPAYRSYFAYDADKSEIFKINPITVIQRSLEGKRTLEVPFQMHTVGGIFETGRYGWGVDFYNTIIKGFVPAMIVGRERKNDMFLPGAEPQESAATVYGRAHSGHEYLAEQGIADSFWEFSFGGCFLFLIAGILTKHLYDRAMRDRSSRHALLSIMLGWFGPMIVYGGFLHVWRTFLLVFPVYLLTVWYAKIRIQEELPTLANRRSKRPRPLSPKAPIESNGRPKANRPATRPPAYPVPIRSV
jgi:hypothetical protein